MPETAPASYDTFAWFYQKYWGSGPMSFATRVLPILERLLLPSLPRGARILDVCCGTGQLAAELARRGYRVTGVDGSAQMLQFARDNAGDVTLVHGDVRTFILPSSHDAAVCLYDSLNHLMHVEELQAACRNVRAALEPQASFLCDFNMEEGYQTRWQGSFGIAKEDHALVGRSAYDPAVKVGELALTMFRLEQHGWQRTDLTLHQRCYSELEITEALKSAGFATISVYDANRDLGMQGHTGRSFFLARGRPPG